MPPQVPSSAHAPPPTPETDESTLRPPRYVSLIRSRHLVLRASSCWTAQPATCARHHSNLTFLSYTFTTPFENPTSTIGTIFSLHSKYSKRTAAETPRFAFVNFRLTRRGDEARTGPPRHLRRAQGPLREIRRPHHQRRRPVDRINRAIPRRHHPHGYIPCTLILTFPQK